MTTENQNQSIESEIVDGALSNEEISEEELESVAGGRGAKKHGGAKKGRHPHLKNVATAADIANNAHQMYNR